jgi:hypothetical protein
MDEPTFDVNAAVSRVVSVTSSNIHPLLSGPTFVFTNNLPFEDFIGVEERGVPQNVPSLTVRPAWLRVTGGWINLPQNSLTDV